MDDQPRPPASDGQIKYQSYLKKIIYGRYWNKFPVFAKVVFIMEPSQQKKKIPEVQETKLAVTCKDGAQDAIESILEDWTKKSYKYVTAVSQEDMSN